jgi:O-antigen/teichoic acid export membrane protein
MQLVYTRIGHNTGILFLVNTIGAVIGFLMAAVLGRGLGDSGFGRYSFVLTWILSLILVAEFGISTVLTRDLAAAPQKTRSYLAGSLAGKGLLGAAAAVILVVFAPWLAAGHDPEVIDALRWGVPLIFSGLAYSSFTAVFKAHQVMQPILWLTLAGQLVLFGGTLGLLLLEQPLFAIIGWAGLSQWLQCGLAYGFYHRLKRLDDGWSSARRRLDLGSLKLLWFRAWPFALAGILATLQFRTNVLILGYLGGDQALGWYAAANRFVETGKQLPGAFYAAVLPAMAALAGGQARGLQRTMRLSRGGLLAFGLLAALGARFLAQPLLTLTYGPAYQPATQTLQILTLSLIPAGQNSLLIIYLYACGDERFVNLLTGVGVAVNLGLCFVLIPRWGPAGTATALLVAEAVLYLPYSRRARRVGPRAIPDSEG